MSDDRQEPPAGDADDTRALPPDADATRAMPRDAAGEDADATRAMPRDAGEEDVEATRAMPRNAGDATRPLPGGPPGQGGQSGQGGPRRPLDATAPQEPVGAWSGRAGVPPPRPAGYPEPGSEWYGDEQAGRRWWMPILLGILALLLLGLIGVGVWLALRAADRNSDPGPPVPSISAQTSAAPTTAAPTSAAPSSSPPSTPPATTAPVEVPMPPLVGLPEAAARAALDRLDLNYRVQRRASDRPAGTVISTDPEAGYPVGEDDRVTIVVAVPAPPTSGPTTPGSAPATTTTP
ncbi:MULTISPECIES: PASTA domain-containing protein [unclassified Micromonospora]|uniref:PASTA domain-containing protein n=1 Tax=unclassified Micromonospora TaxID=2617518 RepID=UPI001C2349A8|nr:MULTISPECIES: PASTA domain-containing protein [unclassified Micromonospora]MBU8858076.1 PASTA domain-containing protein [Micromonospora sp. WMMB482]MDM4778006.1 PASTA domain-containing protein [Micromonospora sp. b486]MDM4783716.1 PASTA domain-containing protein [Micromonospora sp. b486]